MSSEHLRVLVTLDAVGGVWQYSLDLARGLTAAGAQPVLALLGPEPDAAQREEARMLWDVPLVEPGLALDWLCDGPEPTVAAGVAIAQMAQDLNVDLVHLNMPALAAVVTFDVPTIAVCHGCVATWWEAAYPGRNLEGQYAWHRTLVGEGLRAADRMVAPTASHARAVKRHYALDRDPLVVHNGRSPLPASLARSQTPAVLTVGRLWDRVKRADLLDRVAARIDAPFLAAGAVVGPHGEQIELCHLHLLGQIDRGALASQLAARPIFVSAASFEPFGLAILEAAQAGCALVLSDIETFRELWDGPALFIPPDDEDAYATAIAGLLKDAGQRLRLGDAARLRAQDYCPQSMADGMLAIYADALSGAPESGSASA